MRRWSLAALLTAVVLAGGAAAQDWTNNGHNISNMFGGVLRDNANTLAGEPYADVMGTSITIQRQFRKALPSIYSYSQTAHYQNRADAGGAGEAYASVAGGAAPVCPTTMCAPGSRWVMWDVPFYVRETQKPAHGDLGYSTIASGFATGVSRMLGDSGAIGFAIGYDARRLTQKDGYHFRNRADTLHLALYGGTAIGSFFLDGYAGWSRAWNRMERDVIDIVDRGRYKANYRDNVYSAGLKLSRVFILPNDARITPSLGVDLSHVRMDGISERHHSGTDKMSRLESGKSSYTNVALPLMVSLNRTFASDLLTFRGARSLWTPELRAGYIPIVGNKRAGVDFKHADMPVNPTFTTKSTKFAGSYGTAGAGLKMKLADKYILAVDYDITLGKKYRNHAFTAMYGVSF